MDSLRKSRSFGYIKFQKNGFVRAVARSLCSVAVAGEAATVFTSTNEIRLLVLFFFFLFRFNLMLNVEV